MQNPDLSPSSSDLKTSPPWYWPVGVVCAWAAWTRACSPFAAKPMVQHALQRLAQQQGGPLQAVLINANRNADAYLALERYC